MPAVLHMHSLEEKKNVGRQAALSSAGNRADLNGCAFVVMAMTQQQLVVNDEDTPTESCCI